MRIVICEDEIEIREGLERYINENTSHEVVGTCGDGAKGFEIIMDLRPDVVITDIRMPEMSGLDLLAQLKDCGVEVESIIISGYSEFEYARKGLSLGACDYILKPIDTDALRNRLDKLASNLMDKMHSQMSPRELVRNYLVAGESDKEAYAQALTECELHIVRNAPIVMYHIELDDSNLENMIGTRDYIVDLAGKQIFEDNVVVMLGDALLFLLFGTEFYAHTDRFFERKIIPVVGQQCKVSITRGIAKGIDALNDELTQLKEYQRYVFDLGRDSIICKEKIEGIKYCELKYPVDLENKMKEVILTKRKDLLPGLVETFISTVIMSNGLEDEIRDYCYDFCNSAIVNLNSMDKERNGYVKKALRQLNHCTDREELAEMTKRLFDIIIEDDDDSSQITNAVVRDAINYIRRNYYKDFSLTDVADEVGVTGSYLSRLFSSELGVTYVSFLKDFRISVAKRLLAKNMRVKEVAVLAGFSDSRYFSGEFRKEVGMTPKEYATMMGNSQA